MIISIKKKLFDEMPFVILKSLSELVIERNLFKLIKAV